MTQLISSPQFFLSYGDEEYSSSQMHLRCRIDVGTFFLRFIRGFYRKFYDTKDANVISSAGEKG